jgi:UDP-glucose 4-epimerase
MRVLITGGTGFIGGCVSQYLLREGYEVIIASRNGQNKSFLFPGIKMVPIDWENAEALSAICRNVDLVIHAAGMNAYECAADPGKALQSRRSHTANLVDAAAKNGVKRFIYFSSAHVYTSPLVGSITEEIVPHNTHPYALSHLAAEQALTNAVERGVIEGVVIRLSNAFGAPAHPQVNCWMLLINDLCRQAVTVRKMVLQSTGLQRRDFITMTDTCRAAKHLLDLNLVENTQPVFNVGGGNAPTIWEIACMVQERCAITLGYEPLLERRDPDVNEHTLSLHYHNDHLLQTGFELIADMAGEIDDLLLFCKRSF